MLCVTLLVLLLVVKVSVNKHLEHYWQHIPDLLQGWQLHDSSCIYYQIMRKSSYLYLYFIHLSFITCNWRDVCIFHCRFSCLLLSLQLLSIVIYLEKLTLAAAGNIYSTSDGMMNMWKRYIPSLQGNEIYLSPSPPPQPFLYRMPSTAIFIQNALHQSHYHT